MKKIFTLALTALALFTSVNLMADDYRRTWDFRKGWSETTVALLEADNANWEPQSTGFQNNPTAMTANATPWVMVGGEKQPIAELVGITINSSLAKAKHVQICTTGSGLKDVPCLWLNGKGDAITVKVPVGENVRFGYTAHGNSDRGFKCSAGFADADNKQQWTDADNQVIHEVELINSNTEPANLTLTTVNGGSHIYYIIIGDGDAAKSAKIGYLYYEAAGVGFEELPLYTALKDMEGFTFEAVKVDDGNPTAEKLQGYDAVVLDGSLPADADLVAALKDNIQWQPVFNVNADLAAAFGYGEKVAQQEGAESEMAAITDKKKSWFEGFTAYEDIEEVGAVASLTTGEVWPTPLKLTGTHASDNKYLVWVDGDYGVHNDSVLAYVHNSGHNEYVYYGVSGDYLEGTEVLLQNMLKDVVASKSDITATPKPSINGEFQEMKTTVSITCPNKNAVIYYTIDGTNPTTSSTVYTEPIAFTEEGTVKAISVADGYTVSDISSYDVKLYHQASEPKILVSYPEGKTKEDGDAIVTITSDEDVDIWYNITGSSKTTDFSTLYTGPITLKSVADLTAFAIGKEESGLVQSELVTEKIYANIAKIRRDVVAHFTASGWNTLSTDDVNNLMLNGEPQKAWGNGSNYFFSWGKTAAAAEENDGDPLVDENGEPILDENGNMTFNKKSRAAEVTTNENDKAWKLVSRGQVIVYQTNSLSANIGNFGGYNPARAEFFETNKDIAPTNADIQFAGKASGDVNTASLESTEKYQAPFNVLAYVANISGNKDTGEGSITKLAIEVSTDGTTWTQVGDELSTENIYRNYSKFEVAYEGTDEVYVRLRSVSGGSQGVHDLYILNEGEKSKAMEEEYATGISEVNTEEAAPVKAMKFIENGKLVIKTAKGIYTVSGARIK